MKRMILILIFLIISVLMYSEDDSLFKRLKGSWIYGNDYEGYYSVTFENFQGRRRILFLMFKNSKTDCFEYNIYEVRKKEISCYSVYSIDINTGNYKKINSGCYIDYVFIDNTLRIFNIPFI